MFKYQKLALHLFLTLAISQTACANYLGNPHRSQTPPRIVPANNTEFRVEPGNWWVGLKNPHVELLVQRHDIGSYNVKIQKYKGVSLEKVEKTDNPNYVFLTLKIKPNAAPGKVSLLFEKAGFQFTHEYPLLARDKGLSAKGISSKDIIYLIMPDRFANGDPSNDNVPGMLQGLERDSLVGRHGGDLQGIIDHLDYIQELGCNTIWLNPELENDQDRESYHGYAVTDHYRIDRRFGTNQLYRDFVQKCHARGMKVVRDIVFNHIGNQHYFMKDPPSKDWINHWPTFTRTTYRAPTLVDPYASEADKKLFNDGWFDTRMPDLNQRNPHVANYLIQQAIWWVEYSGLDDFRIDTYTYSDQDFCSRWCKEIKEQYPFMNMFGEIWENAVPIQGYFADNQPMHRGKFDSNLPGVVDFQLCFAIVEALTREQGWAEGAAKIYYILAQDYFYENPMRNQIMLDNHDFTRFYTTIGENYDKYRSGMAFLLTMRGIPQIYYMTEILNTGNQWPSHGNIRKDFPGGWRGDAVNKFKAEGRTKEENAAFNYAKALIRYRNQTTALQTGKLTQFVPVDGVYVYFRYDESKTVMTVLNTSNSDKTLETKRFEERLRGFSKFRDVVSGEVISDFSVLKIAKNSPLVLELEK